MSIIGIDIGTSYSSLAVLDEDGNARPVKVANGKCMFGDSYSFPSAVYVEDDGSIVIGQIAMSKKMRNPDRFKGDFKRDLGQSIPYNLGNVQLLPEDIYKEIFIYFKKCAEEAAGEKITKAYITYPANFSRKKRELVEQAAKKAGLLEVELIDEPTAAAFNYCCKNKIKTGDKLLVYDFGGGTFDVALIQFDGKRFTQVTDSLGIDNCGGIDIDREIFSDIAGVIPKELLEAMNNNTLAKERTKSQIMELSVKVKHQLSEISSCREDIQIGYDFIDYELTRERLNEMIKDIVGNTLVKVKNIVKNAKLEMGDIDAILLVGGTSRIPYVRAELEKTTGKAACKDIDPELAVCMGAALWNENSKDKIEIAIGHYENGKLKDALEIFEQLSEEEPLAQYYLGLCYEEGEGVSKDIAKAISFYKKASDNGLDIADERLQGIRNIQEQKEAEAKKAESAVAQTKPEKIVIRQGSMMMEGQTKNRVTINGYLTLTDQQLSFSVDSKHRFYKGEREVTISLKDMISVKKGLFTACSMNIYISLFIPGINLIGILCYIFSLRRGIKIRTNYRGRPFYFINPDRYVTKLWFNEINNLINKR